MEIIKKSQTVINNFIENDFRKFPFSFLKESDIQGILFANLFNEFENLRITIIADNEKYKGDFPDGEICLNLVKTEYADLFDIVIIDGNEVESFSEERKRTGKKYKSEVFWREPLALIIEIKYCVHGYSIDKYIKGMEYDFNKIYAYKKKGIVKNQKNIAALCLLFIQIENEEKRLKNESYSEACQEIKIEKNKIKKYIIGFSSIYEV